MRIVSLCPSNTELAASLGVLDKIAGVDRYSDWPEAVKKRTQLGPDLDIDIDKVKALKPDLILASLSVPGMEKNLEKLDEAGLSYEVFNPQSLDDIASDLMKMGDLFKKNRRANELAEKFHATLQEYRELSSKIKSPMSHYWEWWPRPVFTPGGTNWLSEISRLAGAVNLFENRPEANVKTDWETIVEKDPEAAAMVWVGVDPAKVNASFLLQRPGADQLSAVKNDRVLVLEEPFYCRPSLRLISGMKHLAWRLCPDIFPENPLTDEPWFL